MRVCVFGRQIYKPHARSDNDTSEESQGESEAEAEPQDADKMLTDAQVLKLRKKSGSKLTSAEKAKLRARRRHDRMVSCARDIWWDGEMVRW